MADTLPQISPEPPPWDLVLNSPMKEGHLLKGQVIFGVPQDSLSVRTRED